MFSALDSLTPKTPKTIDLSDVIDAMDVLYPIEATAEPSLKDSLIDVLTKEGLTPTSARLLTLCGVDYVPSEARILQMSKIEAHKEGDRLIMSLLDYTPSTEGLVDHLKDKWQEFKRSLHFEKKKTYAALTLLGGLSTAFSIYIISRSTGDSLGQSLKKGAGLGATSAVISSIASAPILSVLWSADKLINLGQCYGSQDQIQTLVGEMTLRNKLITKLQSIPLPKEDTDYPAYAQSLKSISSDLDTLGYHLSDTYITYKRDHLNPTKETRFIKFEDSGWNASNFKSVVHEFESTTKETQAKKPLIDKVYEVGERLTNTVKGQSAANMILKLTNDLLKDQVEDTRVITRGLKDVLRFISKKELRVVADPT